MTAEILDVFDGASTSAESWPVFCTAGTSFSYHDMRLAVVIDDASSKWALVFEVLEEEHDGGIQSTPYLVSPAGSLRLDRDVRAIELFQDEKGSTAEAAVICGSFGEVEVNRETRAALLARLGSESAGAGSERSLWVQAYLEEAPQFWQRSDRQVLELATTSLRELALVKPRILLTSGAFAHVIGPASSPAAARPWHLKPSESPVYRSLALTIQAKDASHFSPGTSNLAWELHATQR